MNFFGVNSAAVNGSTIAVVLSAALAVTGATVSANAVITRPAEVGYTVTTTSTAKGTRELRGEATVSPSIVCTAEWSIARDAGAMIRITAIARASYNDVTAVVASSGTAVGTVTQGGIVKAVLTSTATAKGDRTAGAEAFTAIGYYTDISASVKRSGQSTTEREGFVVHTTRGTVTALADKTMLSYAIGGATSAASCSAVQIHGGYALATLSSSAVALGASDTAYATTYSNATANPTHKQLVEEAKGGATSSASVASTSVLRPAFASLAVVAGIAVDARIATLARSTATSISDASANGRLALQGQAFGASTNGGAAEAIAIRPASATGEVLGLVAANGTRVTFGEVSYVVKFSPKVDAISNPSTPAPFERTMRVPPDDRAMRVPFEDRAMRVV